MKTWFNAENWEPWQFKAPITPYVLPQEVEHAFTPWQGKTAPEPQQAPVHAPQPRQAPVVWATEDFDGSDLHLPDPAPPPVIPGLVGELVEHCWNGAPYQIAEVAVASALASMALLCSRTYRYDSMGLNLYILMLAQTSTGKSFGFKANQTWLNTIMNHFQAAKPPHSEEGKRRYEYCKHMIIGEIASAQGLAQQIQVAPSTLMHADEFVEHIKIMAQNNCPAHMAAIKTELLRLTELSGPGRLYAGRKYSKRSNFAEEVDVYSASLSILGTGTPSAFYDDMSTSLITSGLLPRFIVLDYEGNLTKRNTIKDYRMPDSLTHKLIYLFNHSYTRQGYITGAEDDGINVTANQSGIERLRWIENVCNRNLYSANDKGLPTSGLWSRAKANVEKVAALIAIGVNPHMPVIDGSHVDIAINIILPAVQKLCSKVAGGEVGAGDNRYLSEIRRFMAKMYVGGYTQFEKYPVVKKEMIDNGIIQISVVRNYCKSLAVFRNSPHGPTKAFNDAVADMIRYKEIKEVQGSGVCYTLDMDVFLPIIRSLR